MRNAYVGDARLKISYLKIVPLENVRSNLQPRDYLNISSSRGLYSPPLPPPGEGFQGASDTRRRNISRIYNSIPLLVLGCYEGMLLDPAQDILIYFYRNLRFRCTKKKKKEKRKRRDFRTEKRIFFRFFGKFFVITKQRIVLYIYRVKCKFKKKNLLNFA